jgi:hypothetical protein
MLVPNLYTKEISAHSPVVAKAAEGIFALVLEKSPVGILVPSETAMYPLSCALGFILLSPPDSALCQGCSIPAQVWNGKFCALRIKD